MVVAAVPGEPGAAVVWGHERLRVDPRAGHESSVPGARLARTSPSEPLKQRHGDEQVCETSTAAGSRQMATAVVSSPACA
jgi:hypothetical protein